MMLIPLLLLSTIAQAIELDISSKKSICEAASLAADGLLNYYDGTNYGGTVGMFVNPYYWWVAGHAFGGLLDHWAFCENDTYETLIYDALIHQTGDNYDYIPSNQSTTEGNDDQGFWGFAVLEAAERNFTAPTGDVPDWLALSQAVYNTILARWDEDNCNGGLRWQIFTWNSGYDYKNTVSQGCLLHIAARLARFTKNDTYVETAEMVYDWMISSGFLILEEDEIHVFDGANIGDNGNCSNIVKIEWSYNYGILIGGFAYLYNYTEDSVWLERTTLLVEGAISAFFRDSIMYERACQDSNTCDNDQRSFKAIFSRCLGLTSLLVPSLYDTIRPFLESSAEAAALSCTGGTDGMTCGTNWETGSWDDSWGMGEQMTALEVFLSLLTPVSEPPYSSENEGVAVGDTEAGTGTDSTGLVHDPLTITTKDKAASAVITAIVLGTLTIGALCMLL